MSLQLDCTFIIQMASSNPLDTYPRNNRAHQFFTRKEGGNNCYIILTSNHTLTIKHIAGLEINVLLKLNIRQS